MPVRDGGGGECGGRIGKKQNRGGFAMMVLTTFLGVFAVLLFILNIYQYLTQRAALRIAEIVYVLSRHIRERALQIRREGKGVEIVEAHLFGISTAARSLLRVLGRSEGSLSADPATDLSPNGHRVNSDSLIRLADNILYSVAENIPEAEPGLVVSKALERFQQKVPSIDHEAARRILITVARQTKRGVSE